MKREELIPGIKVKTIDHIEVQELISYNPDDDTVTTRLPNGNIVKSSKGAILKGFVAVVGVGDECLVTCYQHVSPGYQAGCFTD